MFTKRTQNDGGFTLIELLISACVILVIAAIGIPVCLSIAGKAQTVANQANDSQLSQLGVSNTTGTLPDGLVNLDQIGQMISIGDSKQICSGSDMITLSRSSKNHISIELQLGGC